MSDDQRDVIEILEHDHREVEGMFAAMRQSPYDDELHTMGTAVQAFKKVAPTRPHPERPQLRHRAPGRRAGRVAARPLRALATNRGTDD